MVIVLKDGLAVVSSESNMSHKGADIYNEYMYENNICTICQNEIWISTENREDSMGHGYEYDLEDGHSEECDLFRAEANKEAKERRLLYVNKKIIMPEESEETRKRNEEYDKKHFKRTIYWNE